MATGSFNGQVQGLNQLQAQEQRQYGRGNYMPTCARSTGRCG
jgi:cytochrome d ubiquinol oxidase subunit I